MGSENEQGVQQEGDEAGEWSDEAIAALAQRLRQRPDHDEMVIRGTLAMLPEPQARPAMEALDRLAATRQQESPAVSSEALRELVAAASEHDGYVALSFKVEDWHRLSRALAAQQSPSAPSREPRNAQNEPPFPGADTVVMSIRDPDMLVHGKRDDCPHEAPHRWSECGYAAPEQPSESPADTQERA